MKINKKQIRYAFSMPWLPFLLLVGVFSNNVLTIGKSFIVLLLIIIFGRRYYDKLIDINLIAIILFFVSYFAFSFVDSEIKTGAPPALLIMPPVMYICGKWLAFRSRNSSELVTSYLFIGLALSFITFLAIWSNFIGAGFEQGSRSINISEQGEEISATILGGMLIILVSFGGVVFGKSQDFGLMRRIIVILFFVLSLLAAVRLGSRTLLFVGGLCLFVGFIYSSRTHSVMKSSMVAIFFFAVGYFLLDWLSKTIEVDFYFRDRMDSVDYGAITAGGRLDLWLGSIGKILFNPFGWSFNEFGYAHNLWLDAARNGGWVSFLLLIVVTGLFLLSLTNAIIASKGDSLFTTFVLCMSTGFMLLFMVEPILDGYLYVFSAFFVFFGVISVGRVRSV